MTTRSDNFERTDTAAGLGTPSSGGDIWINAGGELFGIVSNTAYNVGNGNPGINLLECSASDGTLQVTVSTKASGTFCGLVLRFVDSANYLAIRAQPSNYALIEIVAGSGATIADAAVTPSNGDIITVIASDSSIEVKVNGTTIIGPLTETSHQTGTLHGLLTYGDTASRFGDWSWTDAGGGSSAGAAAHYYRQMQ